MSVPFTFFTDSFDSTRSCVLSSSRASNDIHRPFQGWVGGSSDARRTLRDMPWWLKTVQASSILLNYCMAWRRQIIEQPLATHGGSTSAIRALSGVFLPRCGQVYLISGRDVFHMESVCKSFVQSQRAAITFNSWLRQKRGGTWYSTVPSWMPVLWISCCPRHAMFFTGLPWNHRG